jgi:uncharacterized membrane protein
MLLHIGADEAPDLYPTPTELAEILFCSDLQPSDHPDPVRVRAAISHALRARGTVRACASEMARRFGEDPEGAQARMRWCRTAVLEAYASR